MSHHKHLSHFYDILNFTGFILHTSYNIAGFIESETEGRTPPESSLHIVYE